MSELSGKAKKDLNLVSKAIEGDQRAFTKLYNHYKMPVFLKVLDIVKDRDDAEDLTLEAFGKAFMNLHKYTPNYAFSTWQTTKPPMFYEPLTADINWR